MNKRFTLLPAVLAISLALTACGKKEEAPEAPKADASAPQGDVAKVNGVAIPASLVEFVAKEQLPAGTPITDDLRGKIKDHLIQREVLLQAARAAGLDKDPTMRQRLDYIAGDQLAQAYLKDWNDKHKPSDDEVRAYYDKKIAEVGNTEYKARHILVKTEEEAKEIIAKLDKKAKFADLAKASEDPGSKEKGGDLGWARPGSYVPEFATALKGLEKGKYTEQPIKTQYGYHVILLEDSRPAENPKFEDVKEQLAPSVQQEALKAFVDDLRNKAKVE